MGEAQEEDSEDGGAFDRHCERSEAIHVSETTVVDCFVAEFYHRARVRATRWLLAMTALRVRPSGSGVGDVT
jgi:hypothetical protein